MMAFRNRAADKARRAASGGEGPPAGQDPQVPGEPAAPTVAGRRRLRDVRRARDELLRDLGALVMEMHRQSRHDPALVERKAREAIAVDSEFRALSAALAGDPTQLAQPTQAPPAAADRVDAPPAASDRVTDPPPPSPADRAEAPPAADDDGIPTHRVTTR